MLMRYLVLFYVFINSLRVVAQQVPYINSDILTPIWHNPASYGTWNHLSLNIIGQSVWPGIDDHPQSGIINFEKQFVLKKADLKNGIGVNLMYDVVGFQRVQHLNLNYNLQVKAGKYGRLSLGINPGFRNLVFKDPVWIGSNPGTLPYPQGSQVKFVIGAGLMYYVPHKLYIGLSVLPLMRTAYENLNFVAVPHYFLNTGYRFKIGRKTLGLISFDAGSDQAVVKYSGMISFDFKRPGVFFGVGYSNVGEIKTRLGYRYKKIALAYFLNFQPGNPLPGNQFVHEIRFSYQIPNEVKCSTCEYF